MDNYPARLAPEFNSDGSVATPFDEWWARVRGSFSAVPEDVAREWIHRHWSCSPYGFLSSSRYSFEWVAWSSTELREIRVWADNFDPGQVLVWGMGLLRMDFWVAKFMRTCKTFPSPIIVLDNRTGAIGEEPNCPKSVAFPSAYILVEGHRRHGIGCAMQAQGLLAQAVPVWLMRPLNTRA